jgi:hypothetical protein
MYADAIVVYLEALSCHLLEGVRKTTANHNQDSHSPDRDLNSGLPEWKQVCHRPQCPASVDVNNRLGLEKTA